MYPEKTSQTFKMKVQTRIDCQKCDGNKVKDAHDRTGIGPPQKVKIPSSSSSGLGEAGDTPIGHVGSRQNQQNEVIEPVKYKFSRQYAVVCFGCDNGDNDRHDVAHSHLQDSILEKCPRFWNEKAL